MATDIDRLFNAVKLITSGEPRPRSVGITFAYIWLMTNDLFSYEPGISLYVGDTHQIAKNVQSDLYFTLHTALGRDMHLKEPQLSMKDDTIELTLYGKKIIFSHTEEDNSLKRYKFNKIYIDTNEDALYVLHYIRNNSSNNYDKRGHMSSVQIRSSRKEVITKYSVLLDTNGIII